MMTKKIIRQFFIILLCFSLNEVSAAPLATSGNSAFYYKIGGARSISLPPNANVTTKVFSGALELGFGYSCGNFDYINSLKNAFTGVSDRIKAYTVSVVTGLISSLPMLIVQRVNPGLYDLFQNLSIKAEALVALANKSCEDYEAQIRKGENPYSGWTDLAKTVDWKVQMGNAGYGSSSTGVVEAKRNVQKNNGEKGVPWIGGAKKGGKSQPAIRMTYDVVKAGYNITLNRNPDADVNIAVSPASSVGRADQVFAGSKAVGDWAVDVLGDVHVKTHDNHIVKAIPGHGLSPKIAKETDAFQTKIVDLVNGTKALNLANLEKASSSSVLLTRELVEAIRVLDRSEQAVVISKLSSEAAMSSVMEKALYIRRFIATGAKEPNVLHTDAKAHLDDNLQQMDREINNILFEKRVYAEIASATPALIMELKNQYENRSLTQKKAAESEHKIIQDGAVTP